MRTTLADALARLTREGELYEKLADDALRCVACGHRCVIPNNQAGICKVRFNAQGVLRVPFGYVAGLQIDPIEKKPFFHVLPGARALSFGMLGCNLHCAFCQNWLSSQTLRDAEAGGSIEEIEADEIVAIGRRHRTSVVTATYNEPLITSEWALSIMRGAREAGMIGSFVSNGYASDEVLDALRPFVSCFKVDLKSFRDQSYRRLGGTLERVLASIRGLYARGYWVEVVTLLVPNFNDSNEELRELASFLASVSRDMPWHVTAFHPDYQMSDRLPTAPADLLRAAEIGVDAGLRYVYSGNLPGRTKHWENTYCPSCRALLVERMGFQVLRNRLMSGACPDCSVSIPGVWGKPRAPLVSD
ncbi:MAG: AmmeMemoRadiSam system radical SAM enzyme [Vicinamibacteria bacterium]|jgi:pyruvate formate lyase activating enzyme|nr:AmmeMemoRadiSam system radical SAM enzyme [Vicinamibacteria bacterium]